MLTDQQSTILTTFNTGQNVIVEAVPGSGKTFLLTECAKNIPSINSGLALSFNKGIAEELEKRMPAWVNSSTTHADAYRSFSRRPRVDGQKLNKLQQDLFPSCKDYDLLEITRKLVTIYKDQALFLTGTPPCDEKVAELISLYNLTIPENTNLSAIASMAAKLFTASVNSTKTIDFADMLYLPVLNRHNFQPYSHLLVDEAQDLSPIQKEYILHRAYQAQLLIVGDSKQAIYGFRGADVKSMSTLQQAFEAVPLPMNLSFRCPSAICREANTIYPDSMRAASSNIGELNRISAGIFSKQFIPNLGANSILLCRINAPLFRTAFALLKEQIPVRVKSSFGKTLSGIMRKCKSSSISGSLDKLNALQEKELQWITSPRHQAYAEDKYECLRMVLKNSTSYENASDTLTELLNSKEGVLLSTVHSAKGLESPNVYILSPNLMPHPKATKDWEIQQERNIKFVAVTRSLDSLTYID